MGAYSSSARSSRWRLTKSPFTGVPSPGPSGIGTCPLESIVGQHTPAAALAQLIRVRRKTGYWGAMRASSASGASGPTP
jgi:hypothetical protein